jgi:hypothetical protein
MFALARHFEELALSRMSVGFFHYPRSLLLHVALPKEMTQPWCEAWEKWNSGPRLSAPLPPYPKPWAIQQRTGRTHGGETKQRAHWKAATPPAPPIASMDARSPTLSPRLDWM